MSVVRDLVLMVAKIKHSSERSQMFQFSSSEVKQRNVVRDFIFQSLMPRKLLFSGLYYNSNNERNMIS